MHQPVLLYTVGRQKTPLELVQYDRQWSMLIRNTLLPVLRAVGNLLLTVRVTGQGCHKQQPATHTSQAMHHVIRAVGSVGRAQLSQPISAQGVVGNRQQPT